MKLAAAALGQGLVRALASPRLVALLLLANLALACVALVPVFMALDEMLAPMGENGLPAGAWPTWLDIDFHAHAATHLALFAAQVPAVVLLFTLLSAFLTAGVLGVLHDGDGAFTMGHFLRGSGRYGMLFLRILVVFLTLAWLSLWVLGSQLGALLASILFEWPSARGATLLQAAHQVLVVVAFYGLAWAAEIGRVLAVVEKRRSALGAYLAGLAILGRSLPAVLLLLGTLALVQVGGLMACSRLLDLIPGDRGWLLAMSFALVQASVVWRLVLRVAGLEALRRWLYAGAETGR